MNRAGKGLDFFRGQLFLRPPETLAFIQFIKAFFNLFPGDFLHLDTGGRINLESLSVKGIAAVFFFDIAPDLFGVVRNFFDIPVAARLDLHNGINGFGGLNVGNIAFIHHTV